MAFFGAGGAKINSLGCVSVSQLCAIGIDPTTIKVPYVPYNYNKVSTEAAAAATTTADGN